MKFIKVGRTEVPERLHVRVHSCSTLRALTQAYCGETERRGRERGGLEKRKKKKALRKVEREEGKERWVRSTY